MSTDPQIILHHYDSSPFSEKVRVCLGIKQARWSAVDQPVIMPKPQLVPLTGGYRKIPVLQIGADIYCDSSLIVRVLEQRLGGPSLYPSGSSGLATAMDHWADKALFPMAVIAIFGTLGDGVDPAFVRDREALSGQPFNIAAMKAMVPHAMTQIAAHAALLADHLADDRAFLEGERPGAADAAAYYNFWFLRSFCPQLEGVFAGESRLERWYDRVRAIGHGHREAMTPDQALAVAREASPAEPGGAAPGGPPVGSRVIVAATDYGCDPVAGIFAGSAVDRHSVLREDPELGRLAVHVPRAGFRLQPAPD